MITTMVIIMIIYIRHALACSAFGDHIETNAMAHTAKLHVGFSGQMLAYKSQQLYS